MRVLLDFRSKRNYAPIIDLVNELSKKFTVFFIPNMLSRSKPNDLHDDVIWCSDGNIRNLKPDVIFSTYSNLLACAYLKVKLKLPLVNYIFIFATIKDIFSTKFLAFPSSYKFSEISKLAIHLMPKSWLMPDKVILPNSIVRYEMVRLGFDNSKLLIIPWGINIRRYDVYCRSAGNNKRDCSLVYAGPLHPLRFSASFLRVFYEIKKRHDDACLFLLFRRDLWHKSTYKRLMNILRKLNLEKNVSIKLGLSHDEYLRYVSQADAVILPYFSSGIVEMPPFTLLECMILSKPVITSSGLATYGIVENGVNSFIMPENMSYLTNLIDLLISDKGKASYIGRKAREFVCENYNLINFVNELSYLLETLGVRDVTRL